MAIIQQYPYINENGIEDISRIKTYSDNNNLIIQQETGIEYEEAIDTYPCKFHYIEKIRTEEETHKAEESNTDTQKHEYSVMSSVTQDDDMIPVTISKQ